MTGKGGWAWALQEGPFSSLRSPTWSQPQEYELTGLPGDVPFRAGWESKDQAGRA